MINNKSELEYYLALWLIPDLGNRTIRVLHEHFPKWYDLFATKKSALLKLGLTQQLISGIINPNWKMVEKHLNWVSQNSLHHIITLDDFSYPKLLKETADPPPILFIRGDISILHSPQLALVGSRNPSHTGLETAFAFASELASSGFTITSGLAMGIDAACHRGALNVKGKTIAVMGTGVDIIYPLRNVALAEQILNLNGALVSELPLGATANAQNFPRRNRIISGLSFGTLVIEATLRSGSLITANLALNEGREVFAIPGSIHNPLARGCHVLLKQGAKLVEIAEDVLMELPHLTHILQPIHAQSSSPLKKGAKKNELDPNCQKLLECVGYELTSIDILIMRSKFKPSEVASMLTTLELRGFIKAQAGGYIKT